MNGIYLKFIEFVLERFDSNSRRRVADKELVEGSGDSCFIDAESYESSTQPEKKIPIIKIISKLILVIITYLIIVFKLRRE